ncbi:MAG: right-handed parallel beta-helix repeat-containing protein [Pseudomonadota bacterium]|nr:right-handed parallel beta-helix repeat-containing protein [Pseudomonadota bacterium]
MVLNAARIVVAAALLLQGGTAKPRDSEESQRTKRYVVREAAMADVSQPAPALPDLAPYNEAAVRARLGENAPGRAVLRRMVDLEALGEFVSGQQRDRLVEWARRQNTNPRVISIEGGRMTLADLVRALPDDLLEEEEPGIYTLRLPILVAQGATLLIDRDVRELRLSQDAGAFLVNDGRLFVLGTRITGWRERERSPASFRDGREFRPFLVSWGGAELYVTNSRISHLGYSASKAYGISVSQYSPGRQKRMQRPSPVAWLLNSEFINNWFGFYCFEADDVVIIGNRYDDNIVYGVDPHDRSHRLIIAGNTIHNTRKKHGLIVSREVNDSWIFDNVIGDNKLSGLVLDRSSVRNVVADNTVYDNGSDGITVYESPDNLIWGNRSIGNDKHGIRVRNSVGVKLYNNRVIANRFAGIYGHVKDLHGTDRNLQLDPFEQQVSMVVVGGQLVHNGSGPVSIDKPLSLELFDVDLLAPSSATGITLDGVLGEYQHRVLDLLVRRRRPVLIEPADKPVRGQS